MNKQKKNKNEEGEKLASRRNFSFFCLNRMNNAELNC